jgi:hypothetical protein
MSLVAEEKDEGIGSINDYRYSPWLTKYVSGKIESFDSFSKTGTEVDGSSVKEFGND